MRLFTAIELPVEMLLRLDRLIASLRPETLVKWTPVDNLHIKTFSWNWPESRLPELDYALAKLADREAFDVEVRACDWFPNERSPVCRWLPCNLLILWWPGTESNRRRQPFQGCALPTELPGRFSGML